MTANGTNQTGFSGASALMESVEGSKESREPQAPQYAAQKHRVDNVQLKGKNTFAVPRNVRALGMTSNKPKTEKQEDENPKSNDEFRKMFLKG